MAKVAVENSLTNIKNELSNNGFNVVEMQGSNLADCDCCVISGQDKDVMGMADTTTKAPVINAQGMTAAEVVDQVRQRVGAVQ